MTTYFATQTVAPGLYFNRREWKFENVEETGKLPGTAGDRFLRVPPIALLLVGPILGLVYAVFLPFIGLAMVAGILGRKALRGITQGTRALGRLLTHHA